MQEEVESRALTLAINTAKLTGRTLKNAIAKFMAYRKNKKRNITGPNLKCCVFMSLGTKKDATYFFVVGHEPTQPYFPLNILDF